VGAEGHALHAGERAEQHDAAAPARREPPAHGMREVRGRAAVQVDRRVQLGRRPLQERPDRHVRRVAHEQAQVQARHGTQDGRATLLCGRVGGDGLDGGAVGGTQPRGQLVQRRRPAGHQDDVEAACGERLGEGGPDAVRGAHHERPRSIVVPHRAR